MNCLISSYYLDYSDHSSHLECYFENDQDENSTLNNNTNYHSSSKKFRNIRSCCS